jgi:hypothetical protein
MPNLHLLTQTFSQARRASGTHQINGLETPHTDLMGIWWNEDFDPQSLSCPRGGIFPERLDRFGILDPAGNAPPFRTATCPEP